VSRLTAPGAPFEMETLRIDGRPTRVFRAAPRSLRTIVDGLEGHGDALHLVYNDERISYAATAAQVRALAAHFVHTLGIVPGDRIAIAARNLPEWPVAFWATVAVGAVAVPLNAWWQGDELRYGLARSGSRVLVADDERLQRLEPHLPGLRLDAVLAVRSDRAAPVEVVLADDPGELPPADPAPDDAATIFYTSGTTGRPRGALGTHRNMLNNLLAVRWRVAVMAEVDGRVPPEPHHQRSVLLSVPLFHVTGAHSVMLPAAAAGSKIVIQHRWDPAEACALVERERITTFTGVPTMAWELLHSPAAAEHDLSSLTYVGSGGAPAPPDLVRLVHDELGVPAGNGYGMTESSALAVAQAGEAYLADPSSIGRPVPVNDVRIVGEGGHDAAPGDPGELWIRGPCVVRGYWQDPEATAATFVDGWLRTGDVAVQEPDGRLRLVDRLKDIVIRGGENISTVEIEAAVYEHPAVLQAAVFGVPDERLGEQVALVAVPRPGADLDPGTLRAHLAARLASFKVPAIVEVRPRSLPTNAAGKFLKRQLREEVLREGGR
jgi:steroid-24-oyl-CoA synthetase